jgi:peptidyl-dipeptidase Dcp
MERTFFAHTLALFVFVVAAMGCGGPAKTVEPHAVKPSTSSENPLLKPWQGPHGGTPPFAAVKVEHFAPALEAAMAEQLAEIDAIAASKEPATFENTIVALEKAGQTLERVGAVYGVWSNNMSDATFQAVEKEMAPKLAAFSDKIVQNAALFARVAAVYDKRKDSGLNPEQQRLVWDTYTDFVRAGAKLDGDAKKRVAAINQELATLFTQFSQNVLHDESELYLLIENEADLAGLPADVKAGAAAAATKKGHPGKWAILNTRSSMEPFLTFSDKRDLREKVWRTYYSRGDNGDAYDNNQIIAKILKLRAERASILGYKTHAHWSLENSMAKTPERALDLLEKVWIPAVGRVREEVKEMQALAKKRGDKITIEGWDYRYYAEKVRKAKYDLDENEIKPYMQLDRLREGMFWVAGELFGLYFTPTQGIPVYHPDVAVWEVKDKDGQHVGLWFFDPYAREGKRSGAWMNAYRDQHKLLGGSTTIVSNNSNFVKGKEGEPVLISWTDATTLFHEFGHALHGLSSRVTYPSLSGTSVPRDYVEFPSQLLEHWLSTPELMNKYALHYQTGKPIPKDLVKKIEKASTFNQGFETIEYLASALIDMKIHLAGGKDIDPDAFERDTLKQMGMPKEIVMRHRTPQFSHVFSDDGYAAGYYCYLWSDSLTADAYEAFTEGKGPYDKAVAKKLLENVFAVGNTVDPADGYRAFRGRDPGIDALMRKRGFSTAPARKQGATN